MEKKLQQRQGQLVYKGMAGYDLMVRLQLGIRISIGRANQLSQEMHNNKALMANAARDMSQCSKPNAQLEIADFVDKKKIYFPAAGSTTTPAHPWTIVNTTTPAHPSTDFKWKDYAPKVFHNLRCMWGVHDAEYMLSLGGSAALWQLNSPGKSGCLFFLSDDEKFLIKTMRKTEIEVLLNMLPQYYKHISTHPHSLVPRYYGYYKHMSTHPHSLVPRYYGVHGIKQLHGRAVGVGAVLLRCACVEQLHGRTVRFVVMSNLFCTDLQMHRKFDLKGSTHGRTSGCADPTDLKTVFKDLDLDVNIKIANPAYKRLMDQIAADAKFLAQIKVMDYSLLLGIHFPSRRKADEGQGDPEK
eukprot:gene635-2071_t